MKKPFTLFQLVLRTISWYRHDTLAAAISVAVCSMVICGALIIGDSVENSLQKIAQQSLGKIHSRVVASGRWFRSSQAEEYIAAAFDEAAVLVSTNAFMTTLAADRSCAISLYGVDSDFFSIAALEKQRLPPLQPGEVILNQQTATHLGLQAGDHAALRFIKHSAMPADAPFSLARSEVELVRLKVVAIAGNASGGNFDPQVSQKLPYNAFIDREYCSRLLNNPGRANMIVSSAKEKVAPELVKNFSLEDYGVSLKKNKDSIEVRSDAVFFPDYLEQALQKIKPKGTRVFGYFVNEIRANDLTVPYSFIAGIEEAPLPESMAEDEAVINSWLANQLQLKAGDSFSVKAFVPGPFGTLSEKSAEFKVARIVEIDGAAADPGFMPLFPGMEKAESCNEWDPALPIDLKKIRKVDEDYWYKWRGLPKVFSKYDHTVKLFANRFGHTTLVRFKNEKVKFLRQALLKELNRMNAGLLEQQLHQDKQKGVENSVNFSLLFSALGFFIILAALLLNGLIFSLHLERRFQELTLMQIAGFSRSQLKKLLLLEAATISIIGAIAGTLPGVAFASLMLKMLQTIWHGALNLTRVELYLVPESLFIAALAAGIAGLCGLGLALRSFFAEESWRRLSRQSQLEGAKKISIAFPATLLAAVFMALPFSFNLTPMMLSAAFFFFGLITLVFTTQLSAWLIQKLANRPGNLTNNRLAAKLAVRRFSRSLAVIRLLACAIFLVLAVSANHRSMITDPTQPQTGTGGFTHYVETSIPLLADLSTSAGRYELKLEQLASATRVVQASLHEGSESSCLNLNRVSRPNIVGIEPEKLQGRFSFAAADSPHKPEWSLLNLSFNEPEVIPAIADAEVIMWSLGKSLGDEIIIDSPSGRKWRLKLVAGLNNSIFQGKVLISTQNFYRIWPETAGSRLLLVADPDKPSSENDVTMANLSTALQRYGAHVETTVMRLASFNRVQNTYLSIFLALGAVALVLGCFGMAVLLHRNLLERKEELGFMRIIGFRPTEIRRLLFAEHAGLFLAGLCSGLAATAVAIFPLLFRGSLPLNSLLLVFVLAMAFGLALLKLTLGKTDICATTS